MDVVTSQAQDAVGCIGGRPSPLGELELDKFDLRCIDHALVLDQTMSRIDVPQADMPRTAFETAT